MKYDIIYCDPPWDYKGQKQTGKTGESGGALSHYPTVTTKQLKRLNVRDIAAADSLCFMWTSSPHLEQAIELLRAWGFKYTTIGFVWNKQRVNPSYYTMSQIEIVIIGKRGRIPKPRGARNIRQYIEELRGRHSAKPNEIRKRIELMFPEQTKIELFARERHVGWHAWGNEIDPDVELVFCE